MKKFLKKILGIILSFLVIGGSLSLPKEVLVSANEVSPEVERRFWENVDRIKIEITKASSDVLMRQMDLIDAEYNKALEQNRRNLETAKAELISILRQKEQEIIDKMERDFNNDLAQIETAFKEAEENYQKTISEIEEQEKKLEVEAARQVRSEAKSQEQALESLEQSEFEKASAMLLAGICEAELSEFLQNSPELESILTKILLLESMGVNPDEEINRAEVLEQIAVLLGVSPSGEGFHSIEDVEEFIASHKCCDLKDKQYHEALLRILYKIKCIFKDQIKEAYDRQRGSYKEFEEDVDPEELNCTLCLTIEKQEKRKRVNVSFPEFGAEEWISCDLLDEH